jgi:hypothetical protein
MEIVTAERDRGRAECECDIAKGRRQFYCQTRGAWGEYMTTLMDERFGVRVIPTSDITNASQISFQAGYNERLAEHINSMFGDASIETALADVDAFRQRRYREYLDRKEQA